MPAAILVQSGTHITLVPAHEVDLDAFLGAADDFGVIPFAAFGVEGRDFIDGTTFDIFNELVRVFFGCHKLLKPPYLRRRWAAAS